MFILSILICIFRKEESPKKWGLKEFMVKRMKKLYKFLIFSEIFVIKQKNYHLLYIFRKTSKSGL